MFISRHTLTDTTSPNPDFPRRETPRRDLSAHCGPAGCRVEEGPGEGEFVKSRKVAQAKKDGTLSGRSGKIPGNPRRRGH